MKFLLLFLLSFHLSAAPIYFISNTGSNSNNGLSSTAPKPPSFVTGNFDKGVQFYFNRGETYFIELRTTGNLTGSVTAKDTLVYGAYGVGAKPIITTRSSLGNTGWTPTGMANVWQKTVTTPIFPRIWYTINGVTKEASKATSASNVSSYRRVFFDGGNTLYFFGTVNPSSYNLEWSGTNTQTVYVANQDYVVIKDLDFRGSNGVNMNIESSRFVTVRNCNIGWDAGRLGLRISACDGVNIYSDTIDSGDRIFDTTYPSVDNPFQNALGDGVYIYYGSKNIEIHHNYISDWGHSNIEITNGNGRDTLKNIHVYENYVTAPDVDYCRGIDISVNWAKDIVIERNVFTNHRVRNQLLSRNANTEFRYNTVSNTKNNLGYSFGIGQGVSLAAYESWASQGMKIHHNIFADNDEAGIEFVGLFSASDTIKNNEITDNVFFNNGRNSKQYYDINRSNLQLWYPSNPFLKPNIIKNNNFYSPNSNVVIANGNLRQTVQQFGGNVSVNPYVVEPVPVVVVETKTDEFRITGVKVILR